MTVNAIIDTKKGRTGIAPTYLHTTRHFFRPPGAANPQKGRNDVPTQTTSARELWRKSARGLLRNR